MVVATFPMPAGTRFDRHTHEDHQLAWAASGVLTVLTQDATWVLPPTRALWIPAGMPHETGSDGRATMRSLYIRPEFSPSGWAEPQRPTPVAASPLLAELIGYLSRNLDPDHRAHAEMLLADLLAPMPMTTIQVVLPLSGARPARPPPPTSVPTGTSPGTYRCSPVYLAANARVSPDSAAKRLTARAPCPTCPSARSSTGRSGPDEVAYCSAAHIL